MAVRSRAYYGLTIACGLLAFIPLLTVMDAGGRAFAGTLPSEDMAQGIFAGVNAVGLVILGRWFGKRAQKSTPKYVEGVRRYVFWALGALSAAVSVLGLEFAAFGWGSWFAGISDSAYTFATFWLLVGASGAGGARYFWRKRVAMS